MIRFKPDTWLEAFLRFFAMIAPDGNVYVEIPAPDLRFAAIVVLAAGVLVSWKRLTSNPRPTLALLAFTLASAVPWLLSSGNGRYYQPILLCAGPLAVALVCLLPLTRMFRLFLAGGLLASQVFVVASNSPFGSWAWLKWESPPYFGVANVGVEPPVPVTYVTLSSISYSLIAPQFPASSRWMNITSLGQMGRDAAWGQDFLRSAPGPIQLVAPSIQGQVDAEGGPTPEVRQALDILLAPQQLALRAESCRLLPSGGLAAISGRHQVSALALRTGFWICPLDYPAKRNIPQAAPPGARIDAVFARVEQMCPRFLPPGSTKSTRINGGALRHYPHSDMKVYVLDDDTVLYKFWRALNPVQIGTVDEVMAGTKTMDCNNIRGRSGLPWEREI